MQKPQSAIVSRQSKLAKFSLRTAFAFPHQLDLTSYPATQKWTGWERNLALIRGTRIIRWTISTALAWIPHIICPRSAEERGRRMVVRGTSSIGWNMVPTEGVFWGDALCAPETAKIPPFLRMGEHREIVSNEPFSTGTQQQEKGLWTRDERFF